MTERTYRQIDLKTARIMIVDDEPINIDVVQAFLEAEGYSDFVTVEDSCCAIEKLLETRPDLLLLDLMMPGISGFEILTELRKHERFQYLPVLILTAATDSKNKIMALDLGATDFLAKPLDPSELVLRVRNTLAAKAYQDQLAFYDRLTGLPNRQLFMEEFAWAVGSAGRYEGSLALLNIEIDSFDRFKDLIGISSSDQLLQTTADRINGSIRQGDLVGIADVAQGARLFRFDSTVFTVLLNHLPHAEAAAAVASRILEGLREPVEVEQHSLEITASIGIATCPEDGFDVQELLLLASSAKGFARKQGGDRIQYSSPSYSDQYEQRLDMEAKLRQAVTKDQLVLYYQPKVDVAEGTIVGAEALVRWQCDGRLIPPGEFIPLAEETGHIIAIGMWCLKRGCQQLKEWQNQGYHNLNLSINLSALQLKEQDLPQRIGAIMEQCGVDPESITLELTESLLIDDLEENILILKRLRALGVGISIDDFGTGYSSLSYLRQLPVDELKIDRSFIMETSTERVSRAIVSTIVHLAQSMRIKTVAEGVEEEQELKFIRQLQCDQFQGFLFSRPVPADQFCRLLQESS